MKKYIKMNVDNNQLSYGNLSKTIKSLAKNKNSALQTEIFCIIFNIDYINDTTVNNYCIGVRSINSIYKQIYLNYKKIYNKDNHVLLETIINLLFVLEGIIYSFKNNDEKLKFINNNQNIKVLCNKLYNIAKNDTSVNNNFITKISNEYKDNNYYLFLCDILFFTILEKKQPVSDNEIRTDIIQNILCNTDISSNELEKFLQLKLSEGINYYHSLKKLADNNNAYANYELGMNEYKGLTANYPRYNLSLQYFEKAAKKKHPGACYMIAKLHINNLITDIDNNTAINHLNIAVECGNIASVNLLGLMYLNGIYPIKKDIQEAIKLFEEATKYDYAYAYNNLGKIKNDINYYIKSADLGESYACNKVGLYYLNLDENTAYKYFNKALDNDINNICYYAYYNLAKYFYLTKEPNKALNYFEISAENNIIEAMIELLYIYTNKYINTRNNNILNKLNNLIKNIEIHNKYNKEIHKEITFNINKIKNKPNIDIF